MHLGHIPKQFQKLSERHGLDYFLAGAASAEDIRRAEGRLGVSLPEQVKLFYRSYNGLWVDDPQLEVLPLERLEMDGPARLHFATLDRGRRLYFDVSHVNAAGQWDIVTDDGYRVTLTMASFWSNKIWAWVEKRRAIWQADAGH